MKNCYFDRIIKIGHGPYRGLHPELLNNAAGRFVGAKNSSPRGYGLHLMTDSKPAARPSRDPTSYRGLELDPHRRPLDPVAFV